MNKEKPYDFESRLGIKLSEGEKTEWKEFAKSEGMTISQLVRNSVREHIQKIRMRSVGDGNQAESNLKIIKQQEEFKQELAEIKQAIKELPRDMPREIIDEKQLERSILSNLEDGKKTVAKLGLNLRLETYEGQMKIADILEKLQNRKEVKENNIYWELVEDDNK